jgi:hypothetical protein
MTIRGRILANAACASALASFLVLALGAQASGTTGTTGSTIQAAPPPATGSQVSGPITRDAGSLIADALVSVEPGAPLSTSDGADRGGRTCRCSCGFPCKSDADCGGAIGSCRGGISCC